MTVPAAGVYGVEIVAWSNGRYAQFGGDGYARLAVAANAYRRGDTWYRDMRIPGFAGEPAPSSDDSVQWLARKIVADDRFAEATVGFWWPAIMGSEVAEPPEDTGDTDFEGRLLAANAQASEVERLARGFPERLPWPPGIQPQGPAGRDRPLEVVPGGRGRGCGPGAAGRAPRRRRKATAHPGGAVAQDRRADPASSGVGSSTLAAGPSASGDRAR